MRFFGKGVKWDPKKKKAKWAFVRGVFETEDPDLCKEMIDAGFKHEGEIGNDDSDIDALRQKAKEAGIKGWHNMKPENLIKKLKEVGSDGADGGN